MNRRGFLALVAASPLAPLFVAQAPQPSTVGLSIRMMKDFDIEAATTPSRRDAFMSRPYDTDFSQASQRIGDTITVRIPARYQVRV